MWIPLVDQLGEEAVGMNFLANSTSIDLHSGLLQYSGGRPESLGLPSLRGLFRSEFSWDIEG